MNPRRASYEGRWEAREALATFGPLAPLVALEILGADAIATASGLALTAALGTGSATGGAAAAASGFASTSARGSGTATGGGSASASGFASAAALGDGTAAAAAGAASDGFALAPDLGSGSASGDASTAPAGLVLTPALGTGIATGDAPVVPVVPPPISAGGPIPRPRRARARSAAFFPPWGEEAQPANARSRGFAILPELGRGRTRGTASVTAQLQTSRAMQFGPGHAGVSVSAFSPAFVLGPQLGRGAMRVRIPPTRRQLAALLAVLIAEGEL